MSTKKFILLLGLFCTVEFIVEYCYIYYFKTYKHMTLDGSKMITLFIVMFIFGIPEVAIILINSLSVKSKAYKIFEAIKSRNEKSRESQLLFYVGERFRSSEDFNRLLNLSYSPVSTILKVESEDKDVLLANVTLQDNREYTLRFVKNAGKTPNRGLVSWRLDGVNGLGF